MTYVSIKLNEETYKHISTRLNKNSARRYFIVNEMFDDFKKIYANSNTMQNDDECFYTTDLNKQERRVSRILKRVSTFYERDDFVKAFFFDRVKTNNVL